MEFSEFLPIFDYRFFLSGIAVFIAGTVRGFAGFGSALIMVPCIAMLYNPLTGVISALVVDAIGGFQMLPVALRHSDRKTVIPLSIAAIIGIPTGAYILISLDPELMKKAMAIAVLIFVLLLAFGWKMKGKQTFTKKFLAGLFGGMLGGSTGFTGPPVILYLMSSGQPPQTLRASISLFFICTSIISIATFSLAGVFNTELLIKGVLLTPFSLVGIVVGGKMFHLATEKLFKYVALVILTIVGITTLISS